MTNEYLFTDDKHRDEVEKYKPESATVKIANIAETSLWTASFSVVGQGEDAAHKLSNIHLFVMKYSPMVLSCQSSEYYTPIVDAMKINMPSYGDGFSKIVQSLKELQGRVNLPQIDTSALESIRER